MTKLTLDLDQLEVASFETTPAADPKWLEALHMAAESETCTVPVRLCSLYPTTSC